MFESYANITLIPYTTALELKYVSIAASRPWRCPDPGCKKSNAGSNMSCSVCALPRHCAQQFQKKGKAELQCMGRRRRKEENALHLNHPHPLGLGKGSCTCDVRFGWAPKKQIQEGIFRWSVDKGRTLLSSGVKNSQEMLQNL